MNEKSLAKIPNYPPHPPQASRGNAKLTPLVSKKTVHNIHPKGVLEKEYIKGYVVDSFS